MAAQEDVQQVLSLLKRAIRSSGLSQKEVDRRIGVQPGYLSQVMIGRLDLKLKHLLRALEAIEVDPGGFFNLAFPDHASSRSGRGDLLSLLPSGLTASRGQNASDEASTGVSDSEFQRLVARALAEELGLSLKELQGSASATR
jgi:transcriptional regulator with XRE-family HTH domain